MLQVTETAFPGAGLSVPQVTQRREQHYLGIRAAGLMRDLPKFAPQNIHRLLDWMKENGVAEAPTPFFRYLRFDRTGGVELEIGATADKAHAGDGDVRPGTLPAGHYAAATYTGPYDRLYDAFMMLSGWIDGRGLEVDGKKTASGRAMACQVEFYRIAPQQESDPRLWETDIAVKLVT